MLERSLSVLKEFVWPEAAPVRALPNMDGALTPNDALDLFEPVAALRDPEDILVIDTDRALVSAGTALWSVSLGRGTVTRLAEFPGTTTGIHREGDRVLVCVATSGLFAYDLATGSVTPIVDTGNVEISALSAVTIADGRIFVTNASQDVNWASWPYDLMGKNASGSVLEVSPSGDVREIVSSLSWPYGLCAGPGDALVVSEAWSHRVVSYGTDGTRRDVLCDRLCGYPARIHRRARGGFLLALFALRTHLVEFVLREDGYRKRMMEEVPVEDWVCPAFRSTLSVREPFQLGRAVHLGEVKPWAPSRSYGLVVQLDDVGTVRASYHSRARGRHHGVTAACEAEGRIIGVSRGADRVIAGEDGSL